MSGSAREAGRSTVDRLLTLLDAFDGAELTLTDVAERSQLPIATTHRVLAALEAWGGVERAPNGHYRVGIRLWELGTRAWTRDCPAKVALPLMQVQNQSRWSSA